MVDVQMVRGYQSICPLPNVQASAFRRDNVGRMPWQLQGLPLKRPPLKKSAQPFFGWHEALAIIEPSPSVVLHTEQKSGASASTHPIVRVKHFLLQCGSNRFVFLIC
jgi:hypothetical protein